MATEKRDFIVTPPGRMNWPALFAPNKRGKRTVDLLILKGDPQLPAFIKRAKELQAIAAGSEKLGDKAMYGLMDGDKMEDANGILKKESRPEYAGCIVVRPKTKLPVQIIDEKGNEVIEPSEVYGGRWAQLSIDFYFLSFKDQETNLNKKMVCCSLRGVKLGKHDEKFAGGMIDAFEDFGVTPAAASDDLL
jgi:hypothetical protein